MTAVGFFIAVLGFVVGLCGEANLSRTIAGIGGWMILIGGGLLLAGATIKLWEVMP